MTSARWAAAIVVLCAAPTRADEAMVRAQERYQAGLDHYRAGKYEEALQEFEAAWALKPIPRVLINIGQTHQALGNKAEALEQFERFLYLSRLGDPERAEIEKKVAELAAAAPVGEPELEKELPQPKPLPEDRVDRTSRQEAGPAAILHAPVHEGNAGKAIALAAEIPKGVNAAVVSAHFRNAGEPTFERLVLEAQGNALVTSIPGRRVKSTAIQYYLEAYDEEGRVVAVSGTDTSPHLVAIGGGEVYTRKAAPAKPVSPYRKWFWGSVITAATLLTTGTVTALLAKDRENALEERAQESVDLERGRARFGDSELNLENEGEGFEAISVFTFILGAASTVAAGTFFYLERVDPPRAAGLAAGPASHGGPGAWP